MAIDDRDKRASAGSVPGDELLPLADGDVNAGDRQQVSGLYRGIAAVANAAGGLWGWFSAQYFAVRHFAPHYFPPGKLPETIKRGTVTPVTRSIPDPPNFEEIHGWNAHTGPPDPFYSPNIRQWTADPVDIAFFGGELLERGLAGIRSTHPMRAMALLGQTEEIEQGTIEYGLWSEQVNGLSCTSCNVVVHVPDLPMTIEQDVIAYLEIEVEGAFLATGHYLHVWAGIGVNWEGEDYPERFLGAFFNVYQGNPGAGVDGVNTIYLPLNASLYQSCMNASEIQGAMTLDLRYQGPYSGSLTGYGKARVGFATTEGQLIQDFANTEVCYHHRGIGWELDGRGFARPVTLVQLEIDEPLIVSRGTAWICKEDHVDGLGRPSMAIAAMPVETPPTQTFSFDSYVRMCGGLY